jgi:large subunit ribosomal protein L22
MSKPKAPRRVADNEALAVGDNLAGSPRKLNLVAQLIRNKRVNMALADLTFCRKAFATDVKKVLQSAIANAENNHNLDVDALVITEASVGKSFVMKRFSPRARGRAGAIRKPFSRIRIVVREIQEQA